MSMFQWKPQNPQVLQQGGTIAPDERLPWPHTAAMGVQHVIAMFGATVLAPILMGFDPNVAILMSGIGTLIFFLITGGKVPSYLGSSFAFIGVVIAATAYAGKGPNANIGVALGGIIACGALYTLIGLVVQMVGTGWIERLMPPVVTGAVVAVIGLNLAGVPVKNMAASDFDAWMQLVTFVSVGLVAVYSRGMVQRLLILVGLILASVVYAVLTNGLGLGKPLDLSGVANAAWFGLPTVTVSDDDRGSNTYLEAWTLPGRWACGGCWSASRSSSRPLTTLTALRRLSCADCATSGWKWGRSCVGMRSRLDKQRCAFLGRHMAQSGTATTRAR